MSICPNCGKRVKKGSGNRKKIKGIWMHRLCPLTPEEIQGIRIRAGQRSWLYGALRKFSPRGKG